MAVQLPKATLLGPCAATPIHSLFGKSRGTREVRRLRFEGLGADQQNNCVAVEAISDTYTTRWGCTTIAINLDGKLKYALANSNSLNKRLTRIGRPEQEASAGLKLLKTLACKYYDQAIAILHPLSAKADDLLKRKGKLSIEERLRLNAALRDAEQVDQPTLLDAKTHHLACRLLICPGKPEDRVAFALLDREEDGEVATPGSFKKLFRAVRLSNEEDQDEYLVAECDIAKICKAQNISKEDAIEGLRQEAVFAQQEGAKCTSIVHIPHFLQTDDKFYMIMKWYKNGDLFEVLKARKSHPFTDQEKQKIGRQLLKGLVRIHSQGILHRDLKPENVFLNESNDAAIGDFGLAHKKSDLDKCKTIRGNYDITPPELFNGGSASEKSDVWAMGIILYGLLGNNRALPWELKKDEHNKMQHIKYLEPLWTPAFSRGCHSGLSRAVRKALSVNPDDRPTAKALLAAWNAAVV